jgi:AraC family transcriptional regulator of adaptative response / DNA-3-methyladenine glycosylase II
MARRSAAIKAGALDEVGATPRQLAETLRVQRAKRLADAGDHTMRDNRICFGSLRRFNAAFAELDGRSPSSLRAIRRTSLLRKTRD